MKLFVVLCLVAAAVAAPASSGDAQILKYENDNIGLGNYKYAFEQSDGTRAEAVGEFKDGGKEESFIAVRGQFAWVGPDGVSYTVSYVADENGYKPTIEQSSGGAVPAAVLASFG